jgi:hypothetical protein
VTGLARRRSQPAGVRNEDLHASVDAMDHHPHDAARRQFRDAVLDRVVDERLDEHRRNPRRQCGVLDVALDVQPLLEADPLELEVLVDHAQLLAKRHGVLAIRGQRVPQDLREPGHHRLRPVGSGDDQMAQ